ncbi:hypothetical protein NGB41_01290 [Staphylococcus equorum]|uniref:hypothetical protein n=2 Tax=Staphylococcus equorum TaxID=246432 RepID=UPI0012679897|nr:hypothetical protein [Staphylococcus equorum]MEB7688977.1 hypothetical protein [Staphylococcus equorum]
MINTSTKQEWIMYKSKGYEIAFHIDRQMGLDNLALNALQLISLKSTRQSIIDISINDLDYIFIIVITEEGYQNIDFSWLGPMAFKTELVFYNLSMEKTLDTTTKIDIQKHNTYYAHMDQKMPYILAKNDIYDGYEEEL